MGPTSEVGLRVGVAMTLLGLGALIGPPISGAIEDSSGGFPAVGYYAGTSFSKLQSFPKKLCRECHFIVSVTDGPGAPIDAELETTRQSLIIIDLHFKKML